MKDSGKPLGYYNYTVILTYLGMFAGFLGINYSMKSDLHAGLICLMTAGLCDMFDGAVASTKIRSDQEKCFGIQIDSLSDLICFGVLPALLTISCCRTMPVTVIGWIYVLSALIRLAFFNVDEQERQGKEKGGRKIYYGMPVTSAAILLPFAYIITCLAGISTIIIFIPLLLAMAVLFLMPFRLHKPETVGKICILLSGLAAFLLLIFACR